MAKEHSNFGWNYVPRVISSHPMQLYLPPSGWSWSPAEPPNPSPSEGRQPDPEDRRLSPRGGVLIIEDDDAIRETLADILEYEGYSVLAASDGKEALTLLRSGAAPSLILLDLMMPRMNGWEFRVEQLRSPEFAGIPVVLLSGLHDVPVQALLLEVREFLPKPIDVQTLLEVVRRFCG